MTSRFFTALTAAVLLTVSARAELTGYWTFDTDAAPASGTTSTVLDSSAKGYTGTLTAASGTPNQRYSTDVPPELAGASSRSLDLTGADHYVKIDAAAAINGLNMGNRMTIGFWFKGWPNYSGAANSLPFISKGGNTGGAITTAQGFQIRRNAATNNFWFTTRGAGDDFDCSDSSGEKAANRWTHCTVTFDGLYKSVYLNGTHMKTQTLSAAATATASTDPVAFGAQIVAGTVSSFARVKLDNICMFNHILTAAEIQHLASGADPRQPLDTRARQFGYGEPLGAAGKWGVREWRLNGTASQGGTYANPGDIRYALKYGGYTAGNIPAGAQVITTAAKVDQQRGWLDWWDPQSAGTNNFSTADEPFLTNTAADDNHLFTVSQGCVRIPAGVSADSVWTFFWASDDGAELVIFGGQFEFFRNQGNQAPASGEIAMNGTAGLGYAIATLPPADYNVRFTHGERTGGANVELWAAPGRYTSFAAGIFELVGDTAGGGLEMVEHVPLADFRTSAAVIENGVPATVTLSWDTRFAASVSIDQGIGSVTPGVGSITIPAPAATKTYTLTATTGANVKSVPVTVYANEAPRIQSFGGNDTTVIFGATVALNWVVNGATSVAIYPAPGDVTALTNLSSGAGTANITAPIGNTIYTLYAVNSFGTRTATLTVRTGSVPAIASFTLSDTDITVGGDVGLTWNAIGATSASISPNVGNVSASGTAVDIPAGTTTYTLTASNDYGSVTSQRTVAMVQPIGVTIAGWTVNQYMANNGTPAITSLAAADALIAGTNLNRINTLTGLDYIDFGPGGAFTNDAVPAPLQDGDYFAFVATGTMQVNTAGTYLLGINNDDGGRLRIDGQNVITDDTTHGRATKTGSRTLSAGTHTVEYLFFENTGSMGGEVFWYLGSQPQYLRKTGSAAPPPGPDLMISEFMAENDTGIKDGEGDTEDWIEIYNPTAAPVSLSGYYLTDDPLLLNKWPLPAQPLASGAYLLIWASQKNPAPPGELHANFKLDAAGEYLGLTRSDGAGGFTVVDHYDPAPQKSDYSYGRGYAPPRTGWMYDPTPGGANLTAYLGVLGDTAFSAGRSMFSAPFALSIALEGSLGDTTGATIRYTTKGERPAWTLGNLYTGPITIDKTVPIRAAAFKKGFRWTNTDTHTFLRIDDVMYQDRQRTVEMGFPPSLVNAQVYRWGMNDDLARANEPAMRAALNSIPSVCLTMDQRELTGPTTGIYSNASTRGFEQPGNLEMINQNGDGLGNFGKLCGVRVRGNASRSANNPKHSFRIFFNDQYAGQLDFDWWKPQGAFSDKGQTRLRHMDLRTSQNYGWQNNDVKNTFLREELSRDLMGATGAAYSRCRYFHLYVNGVYWGLYNTDERCNGGYGANYFGGDDDNYDVLKATPGVTEVTDGFMDKLADGVTDAAWRQLWNLGRSVRATGLSTTVPVPAADTTYFQLTGKAADGKSPHATQKPLLDADNLICYCLTLWHSGGFDGPASIFLQNASNNWACLRERSGDFGGFRFAMHDDEHSYGVDVSSGTGFTTTLTGAGGVTVGNSGITSENRSLYQIGPWSLGDGTVVTTANAASGLEYNYKGMRQWESGGTFNRSNPQYLCEDLAAGSLEFRMRLADLAHRHLVMPGGALTDARAVQTITDRAAIVRGALLAEQSRWGNDTSLTVARWERARQMFANWIIAGNNQTIGTNLHTEPLPASIVQPTGPGRAATIVAQLRGYMEGVTSTQGTAPAGGWIPRPLYPNLNPPVFSQYGGVVAVNAPLTLTLPVPGATAMFPATTLSAGVIMVTTDGSDPRDVGGGIHATAVSITPGNSLPLTTSGWVRARSYDAAATDPQQKWSALVESEFIVGEAASAANLVISEINYNPVARTAAEITAGILDRDDCEFVELLNISPDKHVELTGVSFTAGISFDFSSGSVARLAPGQRAVIVRNRTAFNIRYPAVNPALIAGEYTGGLDNGGELLTLAGPAGTIRSFTYDDIAPWPVEADGGASLVLLAPFASPDHSPGANWAAHWMPGGNPGGPDSAGWLAWARARNITDAQSDTDGDGLSAFAEYAFGGDPDNASDVPLRGFATPPGAVERIVLTRRSGAADAVVVVQAGSDLAVWSDVAATVVSTLANGDGTETVTLELPAGTESRRYLRLAARLIP